MSSVAPGVGERARTRFTSSLWRPFTRIARSPGSILPAWVRPSSLCGTGSISPARYPGTTRIISPAPVVASLVVRPPAVSSGSMSRAWAVSTGPVSRPASICMIVTPVSGPVHHQAASP